MFKDRWVVSLIRELDDITQVIISVFIIAVALIAYTYFTKTELPKELLMSIVTGLFALANTKKKDKK